MIDTGAIIGALAGAAAAITAARSAGLGRRVKDLEGDKKERDDDIDDRDKRVEKLESVLDECHLILMDALERLGAANVRIGNLEKDIGE